MVNPVFNGVNSMRVVLLVLSLLIAPIVATAQETTIETTATASDDAAIANRIRDIIAELGGYEDVTVQVADGIVTLRGETTSSTQIADLSSLSNRVQGVVAVKNEVLETTDLSRRINPAYERLKTRLTQIIAILPLVLIALVLFGVIALIGYVVAYRTRIFDRLAPNLFIADLYRQVVFLLFLLGAMVISLDLMNATALLSTILGAAGIIGLALGFAVKDTVENYIASVLLSIRQPFRPNDTVEINGDEGKVIRLTSRATILLSYDGNHIRIPNATVFKSRIVNYSDNPARRFMFCLPVDLSANLTIAQQVATDVLEGLAFTLKDPAVQVWIDKTTPTSVELVCTGWIDQTITSLPLARSEALRLVKKAFEERELDRQPIVQRVLIEDGDEPESVENTTEDLPVDTSSENSLDRIVDADRTENASADLLSSKAPKE